jgi:hypothetical protein
MFSVPDSALAMAADALLVSSSPLPLVNHCRRTYVFGAGLLERAGRSFDAEVLYVASLLHDLGLTETFEDGVTPFETRGAAVATEALRENGASPELTALVNDAIALHLKASSAEDPRPEVAGVSMGAAADVLGLRLEDLPESLVAQALEGFPRLDFKTFLNEVIARQVQLKPDSRIAGYVERFQFAQLVTAAPFGE